MHHLGHINKLYLRTQISKDVSWCMYVLRMWLSVPTWAAPSSTTSTWRWCMRSSARSRRRSWGAQKGLSAMPHSWAKSQKTSKNGIFKKPLNWRVILIPATVWQILNMKLMNDRKRKSSKSAETCLEKFVKSHQVNLIFGGFQPFENTVYRVVVAARRRRRWQPPGHWPSSPAAVPS